MMFLYLLGFFAIVALISLIILLIQVRRDDIKYEKAKRTLRREYEAYKITRIKKGEPWLN